MTKMLLGLAALVTMTSAAAAETYDATQPAAPNETYVIGAASLGAQRAIQASVQLEGGKSIHHSRTFMRGQITTGASGDRGGYMQARVGVERRNCVVRELFCAFGGVDAGYQHDQVDDTPMTFSITTQAVESYVVDAHDLVVVPRAGVEMGRHLKTRLAVELPFYRRLDSHMDSDSSDGGMGLTVSLGAGYAF
jgi:hypothetical protein